VLCCLQFGLYLLHYACIGHFNSQIELLIKFCSTSSPTETISKFYVGLTVCSIYIFPLGNPQNCMCCYSPSEKQPIVHLQLFFSRYTVQCVHSMQVSSETMLNETIQ